MANSKAVCSQEIDILTFEDDIEILVGTNARISEDTIAGIHCTRVFTIATALDDSKGAICPTVVVRSVRVGADVSSFRATIGSMEDKNSLSGRTTYGQTSVFADTFLACARF